MGPKKKKRGVRRAFFDFILSLGKEEKSSRQVIPARVDGGKKKTPKKKGTSRESLIFSSIPAQRKRGVEGGKASGLPLEPKKGEWQGEGGEKERQSFYSFILHAVTGTKRIKLNT